MNLEKGKFTKVAANENNENWEILIRLLIVL